MKPSSGTALERGSILGSATGPGFATVTEISGDLVSAEQFQRLCNRYFWAGSYVEGRDVLEVACGAGQGLGYLDKAAKSLVAGDYDQRVLTGARTHYGKRIRLCRLDAQCLPLADDTLDVVILFEALYYLRSADKFVGECRRVLRPGGKVLIVTANKDLYDFNPSPFSERYYGVVELAALFREQGFRAEFFGDLRVDKISLRQRVLRPLKKLAVVLGLIPKSMKGKIFLKRLVFGKMLAMPAEISDQSSASLRPEPIADGHPDKVHKTIYCSATLS